MGEHRVFTEEIKIFPTGQRVGTWLLHRNGRKLGARGAESPTEDLSAPAERIVSARFTHSQ